LKHTHGFFRNDEVMPCRRPVTVYGEDMEPKTFSEGIIRDAVLDDVEVRVEEVFGKAH
jgi:hypothetical protein